MFGLSARRACILALVMVGLLLSGCGSKGLNRAPVEDRGTRVGASTPAPLATDPAATQPVKQPPGLENTGKPGYYTVKPGDTLIRIALDHGQSRKDIARWSNVDNPNRIEVGQVLRVVQPVVSASATPGATPQASPASADKPAATATAAGASSVPAPAPGASADAEISWIWPSNGIIVAGFDEVKNKGLGIGGTAGDPVLAAADGRVVYVGAGLRGYGNLIILKHNNTYLTAYAHNQTLLIKEDQSVRKGQKIAEMGSSDADRVKLHFEIRRQGKPVDPAKYLPAR